MQARKQDSVVELTARILAHPWPKSTNPADNSILIFSNGPQFTENACSSIPSSNCQATVATLTSFLARAAGEWSIESPPGKPPVLVRVGENGEKDVGRFTIVSGRVKKVWVEGK